MDSGKSCLVARPGGRELRDSFICYTLGTENRPGISSGERKTHLVDLITHFSKSGLPAWSIERLRRIVRRQVKRALPVAVESNREYVEELDQPVNGVAARFPPGRIVWHDCTYGITGPVALVPVGAAEANATGNEAATPTTSGLIQYPRSIIACPVPRAGARLPTFRGASERSMHNGGMEKVQLEAPATLICFFAMFTCRAGRASLRTSESPFPRPRSVATRREGIPWRKCRPKAASFPVFEDLRN